MTERLGAEIQRAAATLEWRGTLLTSLTEWPNASWLRKDKLDHRLRSECWPFVVGSQAEPGNLGPWALLGWR